MMFTGPFNATRHPQKPLPQPMYSFGHIPKAVRNLEGSALHYVTDRDHFHESMAEMLLLCKEAMRRRPEELKICGAKPLSLEYLADRLDIDDPCFGYMVRTQEPLGRRDKNWKKGMLQGFVTCTTFTNWQRSFCWDSVNVAAYECDDPVHSDPARCRDTDGSLARSLQNSVRGGDINMEGIVWPHIAEISLLGALGCGRTLIELVIEHLECMKATSKSNYDYVVLQATDNSIPFYESMGFVRVGAVMLDEVVDDEDEQPGPVDVDAKPIALGDTFVTSNVKSYVVKVAESLTRIAQRFDVDVWDIIFLNKHIIGENAKPSDKPKRNTILFIPVPEKKEKKKKATVSLEDIRWHTAKENETPRSIAKLFDLDWKDIVNGNKRRLPGLTASSRLKEQTRIKISHLDIPENDYKAYAHWSFPDRSFEEPEPSYMMARKINRRKPKERDYCPVERSLKTQISEYKPSELLIPPSPQLTIPIAFEAKQSISALEHCKSDEPEPPKRPSSAYILFATKQRELGVCDNSKITRDLWNNLPQDTKSQYQHEAAIAKELYERERSNYEKELKAFWDANLDKSFATAVDTSADFDQLIKGSLYNKVVRLKEGTIAEGADYTYWYVLTFIPDLKWCHLAPMIQDGSFGPDKPRVQGRPKWKLVDESLGHEVDISSSFVIPIKSRSQRKTLDADKEEWDIVDDGSDPCKAPSTTPHTSKLVDRKKSTTMGKTVVKPSVERVVRKHSLVSTFNVMDSPSLLATFPGSGLLTTVRLVGKDLFHDLNDASSDVPKNTTEPTLTEKRSSSRNRISVVRFDSPSNLELTNSKKAATPVSILIKGGRKRMTDGPHMGSSERQANRRRTFDPIKLVKESSSESSDEDFEEESDTSDEDVDNETDVIERRTSPRLNRVQIVSNITDSPSTRTRRSLLLNSSTSTVHDNTKTTQKEPSTKRQTRSKLQDSESLRDIGQQNNIRPKAEQHPPDVISSSSPCSSKASSKNSKVANPNLRESIPRRITTVNNASTIAKSTQVLSLLRDSSNKPQRPTTRTNRILTALTEVAKAMVRPKRKSAPVFLGEGSPPERRSKRNRV